MLFNSLQYGIFLVAVILIYFHVPAKIRWVVLLAASYYFYMSWNPELILLILFTTGVSYACARMVESAADPKRKKAWLAAGILLCLACLFFFKYFNFVSANVAALLRAFSLPVGDFTLNVILPVGISFYTFQTLSYIVDVYRGDLPAERHFGYFALYVSFFPQLVAGPIERATNLLPQLHKEQTFDCARAVEGARIIVIGLFKKIVVADMLAETVNLVYNNIRAYDSIPILVATFFFAMQIYCDFSGYSDIAVGSAKILGIELMTNFKSPYYARSIKEFWRRWHISLSGWFTDYVYIPLGGSRVTRGRHMRNLMVVFLCSGLWHGASWIFVLWGFYHGVLSVMELYTQPVIERTLARIKGPVARALFQTARVVVTFALVCFSWILFRANSLPDLSYAVTHLFAGFTLSFSGLTAAFQTMELTRLGFAFNLAVIAVVWLWDWFARRESPIVSLRRKNFFLRNAVTWLLAFCVLLRLFTAANLSAADFIYFQF